MARIRSLKPEFWDDRKLARSTSRDARMLYMGLWNQSDEHGRLNGDELWLKGRIFPYDDDVQPDDVTAMLDQLEDAGRIRRYAVDGDPFIHLPKLKKHQRLEPAKVESRHPAPPADVDADSSVPRADKSAPDAEPSTLLYVAGSMDQGAGDRVVGAARGSRLTANWTPSDDTRQWTIQQISAADVVDELEKFRNHWISKTGKDATKLDWDRTWRNWVLNSNGYRTGKAARARGSTADDRVNDGRNLAEQLREEERNAQRKELPA
jgi:hypothetical protein